MLAEFNAFHPSIIVTHDNKEVSNATTFLDLSISIESNSIMYRTYRKPMNTYQYLPSISCHNHRTFRAIVHTELYRLLVTNREAHDFEFQVAFFRSHFIARGHSRYLFDQVAAAYQWHAKPGILQRSSTKTSRKIVPFRLLYCIGFDKLRLGAHLRCCMNLLSNNLHDKLRPVACMTSAPNIFRRQYSRFISQ